jgi:hypothetical protein
MRAALVAAALGGALAPTPANAVAGDNHPACPGHNPRTRSENVKKATRQSVNFVNEQLKPVHLFWVDDGGAEVFMDELQAGESQSFTSYEGHAWRAKVHEYGSTADGVRGESAAASLTAVIDLVVPPPGADEAQLVIPLCGVPSQAALPLKKFAAEDMAELLARRFPKCEAQRYLGERAVPGFHVLCTNSVDSAVAVLRSTADEVLVLQMSPEARTTPLSLRQALERTLELPDPWVRTFMGKKLTKDYHRPFWTLFTPDGLYELTEWDHMVRDACSGARARAGVQRRVSPIGVGCRHLSPPPPASHHDLPTIHVVAPITASCHHDHHHHHHHHHDHRRRRRRRHRRMHACSCQTRSTPPARRSSLRAAPSSGPA